MIKTSPSRCAFLICAILCVLYALLAGGAAVQKSATYDEPFHVVAGWLERYRGDYQRSTDQPALWECWIALPFPANAIDLDRTPATDLWARRVVAALYGDPPAMGISLVNRVRMMSLALALLLAVLIAVWAGQIAGPIAAVAACFAFAFDPNWLANGPMAKNDAAIAFVYFATAYAMWRIGRRISTAWIIALLILPAICVGTKLSGLLAFPVVAIGLFLRAGMKNPWTPSRRSGWAVAGILCLGIALVMYAVIWAEYRFKFDAGIDINIALRNLRYQQVGATVSVLQPTPDQLATWRPSMLIQIVYWLEQHKLLPEAWVDGFIYFRGNDAGNWKAFLLGEIYCGGRWDYFPLVWLFKEPMALIAAAILAAAIGLKKIRRVTWTIIALAIPAAAYAAVAMHGNLNIGFRHFLPVLPFMDVAIGIAAAKAWSSGGNTARTTVLILAAGLAAETLAAYPDFISFFNIACGGERGGITLLGDSNLDWGQDLPLLANWQRNHPNVPLYLDYFGMCDPAAYGIRWFSKNDPAPPPGSAAVAAVSATVLQGLFAAGGSNEFARQFQKAKPIAVLGGTIYLFDYRPVPGAKQ